MTYSSEIDLGGLGQAPKTSDPDTFADFTDVYNAIHILAQWTNSLYENARRKEGAPWETFPLENIFETRAHHSIKEGMICSPAYVYKTNPGSGNTSFYGAIRGVAVPVPSLGTGQNNGTWLGNRQTSYVNGVFGIALSDAKPGQLFDIAVGPGIINVPGLKQGEIVASSKAYKEKHLWASTYLELSNDGSLYRLATVPQNYADPDGYSAVGVGVADDAMMLFGPQHTNDQFGPVRSPMGEAMLGWGQWDTG